MPDKPENAGPTGSPSLLPARLVGHFVAVLYPLVGLPDRVSVRQVRDKGMRCEDKVCWWIRVHCGGETASSGFSVLPGLPAVAPPALSCAPVVACWTRSLWAELALHGKGFRAFGAVVIRTSQLCCHSAEARFPEAWADRMPFRKPLGFSPPSYG